jgi:phage tail sheath gpL-like
MGDEKQAHETPIECGSIYGMKSQRGLVELLVGPTRVQMTVEKAKTVHAMLGTAIEAAISDEIFVRFMVERVGMDRERAAAALLDLRELRQGSREVLNPN